MKPKFLLLPVIALLFASCAAAPLLVSTGITNGLQFGIKDSATRTKVACDMIAVAEPLSTIASVPDPAGLHALLDQYLPAGDTKAITESNLVAVYSIEYETIKAKAPTAQLAMFKTYVDAVQAGASPFCATAASLRRR
ncbi:MAG TPA: hypothetical protein VGI59_09575 [Candidatus Udaeobacter sp.]|jgi:hypothetical protein